jgi:hypothetical protein
MWSIKDYCTDKYWYLQDYYPSGEQSQDDKRSTEKVAECNVHYKKSYHTLEATIGNDAG